ncbi:MAG: hypothetical protein IMW91_04650 [Firmicutes bacterium]|nr:hypothetical protein [Bacillota bacterium]
MLQGDLHATELFGRLLPMYNIRLIEPHLQCCCMRCYQARPVQRLQAMGVVACPSLVP